MFTTSPGRVLSLSAILVGVLLAGCGSSTSTTSTASSTGAKSTSANAADRAFVAEIIPNDQLAVAMAKLAKAHAQHSQLKVLADRIIAADSAQIAQLTGIAKALGVTPKPMKPTVMTGMENDAGALGLQMYQMGMDPVDPTTLATANPFDNPFLTMMSSDLGGAVNLARAELSKGTDPQLRPIATTTTSAAGTGLSQLKQWQSMWYGKGSHSTGGMSGMKGMNGMKGMSTGSNTGTGTTTMPKTTTAPKRSGY